jgi:DNA invertase Pin-like site-specific DNA recombinase
MVIVSAIAELERNLIIERVRAGMRRAKLKGQHIGRRPLDVDRGAVIRDRQAGRSLSEVAQLHRISRALVSKILREAAEPGDHKGFPPAPLQLQQNKQPENAA